MYFEFELRLQIFRIRPRIGFFLKPVFLAAHDFKTGLVFSPLSLSPFLVSYLFFNA